MSSLRAFVANKVLEDMNAELEEQRYRTHEFGDSIFVERMNLKGASVGPEIRRASRPLGSSRHLSLSREGQASFGQQTISPPLRCPHTVCVLEVMLDDEGNRTALFPKVDSNGKLNLGPMGRKAEVI